MTLEHVESEALRHRLSAAMKHARKANTSRVADYFASIALAIATELQSRDALITLVADMFSPYSGSNGDDGGAKVPRRGRPKKPGPSTAVKPGDTLGALYQSQLVK